MASVDASRTRRTFARLDRVNDVPNLIDIQRRSFEWLTDPEKGGLRETISDIKSSASEVTNASVEISSATTDRCSISSTGLRAAASRAKI